MCVRVRPRSAWLACLVICLLVVMPGCGGCGRGANQPQRRPVFPVTGELYLDGKPAKHVMVVLHPVDEAAQAEVWPQGYPNAAVASDGSFKVGTYEEEDGAPEGEYLILVIPTNGALTEPQLMFGDAPRPASAAPKGPGNQFATPEKPAGRYVIEGKDNKIPRISLVGES